MKHRLSVQYLSLLSERCLYFSLLLLLALSLTLATSQIGHAQFSLPEGFDQSHSVERSGNVNRYGHFETAPVTSPLDGRTLFTIASPTVDYRSTDASSPSQSVEERAKEVHDRLWLAMTRFKDPQSLVVDVFRLNNVTIVGARDDKFPRPLVLVSVTDLDADFNGKPIDELATEWRDILKQEAQAGVELFSGDTLSSHLGRMVPTVVGLLAATGIILLIRHGVSRRQKILRQRKQVLSESTASDERSELQSDRTTDSQQNTPQSSPREQLTQQRTQFLQRLKQTFSLEQQLGLLGLMRWFLLWLLILLWYSGIIKVVSSIPVLLAYRKFVIGIPITLLGIWFFIGLTIRISHHLINLLQVTSETHHFVDFIDLGDAQRRKLRTSTITGAIKDLATVLIATTGFLLGLKVSGISTGSVLAIGGLLGLAVSFGSQSLVKDVVNGILILVEDQYAIGDVIDLGRASGVVENLTLRITQLRSADGELITIPNSTITEVKNLTRSWSRVNFRIDVAYQTDPEKALSLLREVVQELYDDPEWHDKIPAPPEVLGIDSISHSGMTITIWIQTVPLEQWSVGREFRLRVRKALEANGIEIGMPRQTYVLESSQGNPVNNLRQNHDLF
ncbi:MAG: mechanosensitive ion channel family protein [Cyanobacteria bacterium RU_5_0]|nr:mechanosensitive ion channel family protein [Cyanobacteria bacterium RU_5_0]